MGPLTTSLRKPGTVNRRDEGRLGGLTPITTVKPVTEDHVPFPKSPLGRCGKTNPFVDPKNTNLNLKYDSGVEVTLRAHPRHVRADPSLTELTINDNNPGPWVLTGLGVDLGTTEEVSTGVVLRLPSVETFCPLVTGSRQELGVFTVEVSQVSCVS